MNTKFKTWDKNKKCIKEVCLVPNDDIEFMQSTGL